MLISWIVYLLALGGLVLFRACYPEGLSAWLLLFGLLLPLFSLGLTLPCLHGLKPALNLRKSCNRGDAVTCDLFLETAHGMPAPYCRLRYTVTDCFGGTYTETKDSLTGGLRLTASPETQHCGAQKIAVTKCTAYDFLRLFPFPVKTSAAAYCVVNPGCSAPDPCPDLSALSETSFRPKPGGGFAEVCEFREYHPGDSIREINWKLSAKTDNLIIREPQIPVSVPVILCLDLRGTRDDMDASLDHFVWLAQRLLEKQVSIAACYPDARTRTQICREIPDENVLKEVLRDILMTSRPDSIPVNYSRLPVSARLVRVGPPEKEVQG